MAADASLRKLLDRGLEICEFTLGLEEHGLRFIWGDGGSSSVIALNLPDEELIAIQIGKAETFEDALKFIARYVEKHDLDAE